MELQLIAMNTGAAAGRVSVPDALFGAGYNETLVHQVVTAVLAGARSGTKAQLSRGEVRASNIKPWRQKGMGKARAGSRASPIWRGGGVTFAASPRNYAQKVNRKMYRAALRSIVSELVRQERLVVVDDFAVSAPKTRLVVEAVGRLNAPRALIVTEALAPDLELAARNLADVAVCTVSEVDPVALVRFDKVIITRAALARLEERLQ